jgi:uncharacterized protein (DUF885 family)
MPELSTLINEYLQFVFQSDPIEATRLGVHEYDRELGDYSAEAIAERADKRRAFLQRIQAMDPATLDADARLDWELARIDLETALRRHDDLQMASRAPYWYVERLGSALSTLLQRRDASSTEIGQCLAARLQQIPTYLRQALANLTVDTAPLHVDMGLTAAQGLERFLETSIPAFAEQLSDGLRDEITLATVAARGALAEFEQGMSIAARGRFACGADHFDFLLRRFHLLDFDHQSLHEFGLERMARDKQQLEVYARELDPDATWMEQIERIKDHHPAADALLETYHSEMVRARAHCVARDLITLPAGEQCSVEWLPEYLRAGAPLGLMNTTPPFGPELESRLLLTSVDPAAPLEQQEQHLRDHCFAFARSITLHEIYPGHHTQKVHHKLATADAPMRRYFSSPVFVEGWGLYTEDLMEETGFMDDPAVQLFKLRNALWRSARVVVDSGLHTRDMSFEEAVDLMCDEVKLDRRMAEGEVRRYTTFNNPTYPSAYLLGKESIRTLRDQWREQQGASYSLKAFHDRLLSYGSPPLRLVAERMVEA